MSDLPTRVKGGWCVEHNDHEIVSFGTDPRGFCPQGDEIDVGGWYEHDCRIEPLMTEAEWREQVGATAPSLDMGDDNEWVMLDIGPWDRLERGNP